MKKEATLRARIELSGCPEHVVLRDSTGEAIELTGPCGRADCVSAGCRNRAAWNQIPNVFGPEVYAASGGAVAVAREETLERLARLEDRPLAQVIRFPGPKPEDAPGMGDRAVSELLRELTGTDG